MADNATAPEYLINDILETDSHGVLAGASQAFKTFADLRMVFFLVDEPVSAISLASSAPLSGLELALRFFGLLRVEEAGDVEPSSFLIDCRAADNTE